MGAGGGRGDGAHALADRAPPSMVSTQRSRWKDMGAAWGRLELAASLEPTTIAT